ncbi:hypothetical protein GTQ40_03495 [Flavobacteriaceae bacterium R38]|nr:hypothetical protein [Flavobacteriaceae bacterium R38]
MKKVKYAALFGGSGKNNTSKEYLETVQIGTFLAEKGYIVKNGGYGGMMEAVSKGATSTGGTAIGVTCKQVGSAEGNTFLTETIATQTLYERLEILIENTDVFIVQKGGIGTLSEVFLALDIIRKEKIENQPKLFFIGDLWNDIIAQIQSTLLPKHEHNLFKVINDFEEFKTQLEILN